MRKRTAPRRSAPPHLALVPAAKPNSNENEWDIYPLIMAITFTLGIALWLVGCGAINKGGLLSTVGGILLCCSALPFWFITLQAIVALFQSVRSEKHPPFTRGPLVLIK